MCSKETKRKIFPTSKTRRKEALERVIFAIFCIDACEERVDVYVVRYVAGSSAYIEDRDKS